MGQRFGLLALATLSGCAPVRPEGPDGWPPGLPPRSYFERVWEADARNQQVQSFEQYLTWVETFYAGTQIIPGWNRRQADLVEHLSADQARIAGPELASLGQLLASEWAKDNSERRVTSQMLLLWGRVMKGIDGPGMMVSALDTIRGDLRAVLSGDLPREAITLPRYSPFLASSP